MVMVVVVLVVRVIRGVQGRGHAHDRHYLGSLGQLVAVLARQVVQPDRGRGDRAVGRERGRAVGAVAAGPVAPVFVEQVTLLLEHALLDQQLELGARVDAAQLELGLGLGRSRRRTEVHQVQVTPSFSRVCNFSND